MDYETLLSVIVGAAIGFLSSLGYEAWRQRRDKEDLKRRIREELKLIHSARPNPIRSMLSVLTVTAQFTEHTDS